MTTIRTADGETLVLVLQQHRNFLKGNNKQSLSLLLAVSLYIRLLIKISKQDKHVDHDKSLSKRQRNRHVSLENDVDGVRQAQAELSHLGGGDPFLPGALDS